MDIDENSSGLKEGDPPPGSSSNNKPFRIKIFPASFSGPFVVFFRKKEKPINVLLISAKIYEKYSSVKEIKKISLDKLRVVFGSRTDANSLLESKLFADSYRVYAPSEICEINGVIYDDSLECEEILNRGIGIFKNKAISPVNVLDCHRLSKFLLNEKGGKYIHSNCFKITFAGSVLPDFIRVGEVVFDVRLFYPKLMHCERCLLFGHTIAFCSNKPKCSKCSSSHLSSDCKSDKKSDICIYCNKKHDSLKNCPVYIENQSKMNQKLKNRNKFSYSEILKNSSNIAAPNIFESLTDDEEDDCVYTENFIYKPPTKRKRVQKTNINIDESSLNPKAASFQQNFPCLSSSKPRIIPGFQRSNSDPPNSNENVNDNQNSNNSNNSSILGILEDLVDLLGFNDFWKKIIKMILPFLASLLDKLNSFGPIIASLFSS